MRPTTLPLLIVLIFSWPFAWAADEDEEHSSHHPEEQVSKPAVGAERQHERHESSVHAKMKHIETLMERIRSISDAAERERLLAKHLASMRDQMKAIRKLSGGMKMAMNKSKSPQDTEVQEEDEHANHKGADEGKGGGMMAR